MTDPRPRLNELLRRACDRYRDSVAVLAPDGQEVSFARLLATVTSFAARLHREGVAPGMTIIPFADNPVVYYQLVLALFRIGATVPLFPSADGLVRAGVPVHSAISLPDGPAALADNLVFDETWFREAGEVPADADSNLILVSSGTTGVPKFYRTALHAITLWLDLDARGIDVRESDVLLTFPAASTPGIWMHLQINLLGGTVLYPAPTPEATLRGLAPSRRLVIITTPALLQQMVGAVEAGAPVPQHLEAVHVAGSPMSRALAVRTEDALGCAVFNTYGSTESGFNATVRPAAARVSRGVVGRPYAWVETRIEGDDGRPVSAGEEGVLAIRVPPEHRMREALVGAFPYDNDGWFRPGDIAHWHDSETLVVSGRADDVINTSGLKVAPWRYEDVVLDLAGTGDVAAFGLPNELGSEDVGIAITDAGDVDLDALRAQLNDRLGEVPNFHLFRVHSLPLGPTGKVDRKALRERFGSAG